MIFASTNEDGEPAWKLVLEDRKTVTRRLNIPPEIFAVQPGRGKKAVCVVKRINVVSHFDWAETLLPELEMELENILNHEAEREGFKTWSGLLAWFKKKGINIDDTYRIEFERIKEKSEVKEHVI